jgi:heme a synthase
VRLIRNKPQPESPSSLHWFAVLSAVATLVLLGAGGLVTSHGVGMAVPDWPNTYGYNMFLFPLSRWVGGVFYEHTHRLIASGVGLMTAILALWLHGKAARPFMRWVGVALCGLGLATCVMLARRWADGAVLGATGLALLGASFFWPNCEPSPGWLRWLGRIAFVAVVLQGVLGGLRVVLFKDALGIFHATLAQLFFALLCALALFTSRWWGRQAAGQELRDAAAPGQTLAPLCWLVTGTTALIFGQLVLGAAMRHQHAGLAIPDFPLAYGKLWPATDAAAVESYNQHRIEVLSVNPITGLHIVLQMTHRLVALCILGAVAGCAWATRRALGSADVLSKITLTWLGLILTQLVLGAATIWSDKAADLATAHVLVGALSLALGVIVSIILANEYLVARRAAGATSAVGGLCEAPAVRHPALAIGSQPT